MRSLHYEDVLVINKGLGKCVNICLLAAIVILASQIKM